MTALALPAAYATRPIRCSELLQAEGWRLKLYEAAYGRERPRPELVEAAKSLVYRLPQPPEGDGRYGSASSAPTMDAAAATRSSTGGPTRTSSTI
jgi:hypothetical protein